MRRAPPAVSDERHSLIAISLVQGEQRDQIGGEYLPAALGECGRVAEDPVSAVKEVCGVLVTARPIDRWPVDGDLSPTRRSHEVVTMPVRNPRSSSSVAVGRNGERATGCPLALSPPLATSLAFSVRGLLSSPRVLPVLRRS